MAKSSSSAAPRYNFASGPAALPPEVLAEGQEALTDCLGTGLSILELPFSGPDFTRILTAAEQSLRHLLRLPETYRVLFLQGGASAHFAYVAQNLAAPADCAEYVVTGLWSRRAAAEAARYCRVRVVAEGRDAPPPEAVWDRAPGSAYCHITTNETADGLQYHWLPAAGDVPLVADMSADLLTRPLEVERFGLIYASAQKNLGIAGLTLVIVRQDLLHRPCAGAPAVFDYARQAENRSKVNTPPTFAIFMAGAMLRWMERRGGLEALAEENRRKAEVLYGAIDRGGYYSCPVAAGSRSLVNVCFRLPTPDLEARFLAEAAGRGLLNLQGHPAVGGIRASLYNPLPGEAAEALAAFMDRFRRS